MEKHYDATDILVTPLGVIRGKLCSHSWHIHARGYTSYSSIWFTSETTATIVLRDMDLAGFDEELSEDINKVDHDKEHISLT